MLKLDLNPSDSSKKKKQKLVKHKRKNWKKTDISEVEQGIDELRQEQLAGGVVAEKKDSDLFYINKTKLNIKVDEDQIEPALKKQRKLTLKEKMENLNCYKSLKPDPMSAPVHHVNPKKQPDIDSKRQKKLEKIKMRKSKLILKRRNIKTVDDIISDSLKMRTKAVDKPLECQLKTNFEKDLWNSSELPEELNDTNEYYYRKKGLIPPKRPDNKLYKESKIPKVEIPHPGTSYNPDYDEHQELLLKAHTIELEKLKKEQREMRRLTNTVKKMTWNEIEKLWLEEMSCNNLFDSAEKGELLEKEENTESAVPLIVKTNSKKSLKKTDSKSKRQKKILLDKIKKRQKENEKKLKRQQNEIYRLKSIKKEINDREKLDEEKKLKKEIDEKHKELFGTKRLGKLKFEEPELDLKLSDEITGNLRTLKPEGNILTDRYKSLQKRNLIEPRERARRQRQYSKKKFDKRNAYEKTHYIK